MTVKTELKVQMCYFHRWEFLEACMGAHGRCVDQSDVKLKNATLERWHVTVVSTQDATIYFRLLTIAVTP